MSPSSTTTFQVCNHPVFVIGAPRSGTSILAWSLHHHPDFWTSDETEFLHRLFGAGRLKGLYEAATSRPKTWLRTHGVDRAEFLAQIGLGVNALFTSRSKGKRWVDQTPGYTLMVDDLAELFPGARFLHIVRDGRSVVRSMIHFRKSIGKGLSDAGGLPSWAKSFEEAVETWRLFVTTAQSFCDAKPDRGLTVVNESLAANPAAEFKRILEFLEAPPAPGPANFFASSRINSSFQPLQWGSAAPPASVSSAAAALPAEEAWLEWTADERSLFLKEAGALMVSLGFMS
jgi:hypothetical protein